MAELPANEISIDQDETAPTGKPVSPVPPRYWWLKRVLVVSAALFVVLLGVRLWWGWEADRRLQAEIDRIIAAGEPLYPADFDPEPMRLEENAAKLYLDAEAALGITPTQREFVKELVGEYAEIRKRTDEIEPFILANAKAFELIRRAGKLNKVDWGWRCRSPASNTLLPNFGNHGHAAKTLSIACIYHAERGDVEESLSTLFDTFRISEAIDRGPTLIHHLSAAKCRTQLAHDLEYLVPKLPITSKTREMISLLSAKLLDERGYREALVRALQAERMLYLDMSQMLIRGDIGVIALTSWGPCVPPPFGERVRTYPLIPAWTQDATAGIQFHATVISSAGKNTWPDAKKLLPTLPSYSSRPERLAHPISNMALFPIDRAMFNHFRAMARTRMAAIALAIRLYEADLGHRPETLEELVPAYLTAVPIDPLDSGARPIRYRPHAPKPILYCVGENAVDDGGSFAIRHDVSIRDHGPTSADRKTLDLPFFLDCDRPTQKP